MPTAVPPAALTEVNTAIATTLADIFKQFGDEAANTALLKQQRAAADREFKKKRDEYNKGRSSGNHEKFPASEESQRKARDHAERQLKTLDTRLEEKDNSLKNIATSAAVKIPTVLGPTSGGTSTEEHQKMLRNCEDLAKRCNNLQQQLEDQKKQMEDEKKARAQLEKKHSELVSQYKTTQNQVGEAKTLQSKIEGDIRSELKKEALNSQKEIQELKRGAASALSDLSRVPPDLQETLKRFEDFFQRLNGLPNVEVELQKLRGEVAENAETLKGEFSPLNQGLEQAKSDIATHAKYITDTAKEQGVFQEKLKEWKKGIDSFVSAANKPSKQEYISKQDFAALKQQVARIGSKPATPPADLPLNPNILRPLQSLEDKVQTLEVQFGTFDLSRVENKIEEAENRLSVCEENSRTYAKASRLNEALDEVADVKKTVDSMDGKWASLKDKVDRQHKETSTRSPVSDNHAGTPMSGSRAGSASLSINTPKSSELELRLSQLEGKVPPLLGPEDKIATREWVKAEIEGAHEASDEFVAGQIDALQKRVATNERNIDGTVENIQRILSQNTAVVETAVAKSILPFETKHANNLGIVQQNLQTFHDHLFRQDGGVMIRLDGLTLGLTSLDSRIAKINTLDLHQAMVHQFHQEQFPQLQILPSLEIQAQATAERLSALEKVTKDSPLSGLQDVQEANQSLADKVNALNSRTSNHNARITTLETRSGKETESRFQKEMRSELDRNTHDLSKLNSKMKIDFQTVVPRVVQLEDEMENVRGGVEKVKGDMTNHQDVIANRFADVEIKVRDISEKIKEAQKSTPSTSPFNNNPNNSIRDRKTSTPIANGTIKKRKLENGHSTHSSFSNSRTNGASRGSSIDHSKKSKRRRRNPEEDEDDDDYEEVRQPALMDSDSEEDDD